MRDLVEDTLKDTINNAQASLESLTKISIKAPMQKSFIKPVLTMVLKSCVFQQSNLKMILTRYLQHKAKKGG